MAIKNDIAGDEIKTGMNSKEFEEGWKRIFGKKKQLALYKTLQRYAHLYWRTSLYQSGRPSEIIRV